MRRAAVPIAIALTLAWAAPVLAGAGLPQLASLQAGPYSISLHNDSPTLVTGRNTLTVEVPSLAGERAITLSLLGPAGQVLVVPLRPVTVLGGDSGHEDEGSHGGDGDHTTAPTGDAHQPAQAARDVGGHDEGDDSHAAADDHSAAETHPAEVDDHPSLSDDPDQATDDHRGDESSHELAGSAPRRAPVLVRGEVDVPAAGIWRMHVTITDPSGAVHGTDARLTVAERGPNRVYLASTGSLIGGALLFGLVQRRRGLRPTKQSVR